MRSSLQTHTLFIHTQARTLHLPFQFHAVIPPPLRASQVAVSHLNGHALIQGAVRYGAQDIGTVCRILAGALAERHGVVGIVARGAGVDGRAATFVVRVAVRVRAVAL